MFSTRWIKILRDIHATPVRIAIMLVMMAIGVFSFTLMLSTYTTLKYEISRNYLETNPASASLEIDSIDENLLSGTKAFAGISQVQASATIDADIYFQDGTLHPLKIFVIDDFKKVDINLFYADKGAWPPLQNTLLLERSSLAQIKNTIGDSIKIRLPDGNLHSVNVSGTVHDPAIPVPSMAAFAYVSPSTLNNLGVKTPLTDLKITVDSQPFNENAIEQTASQLAAWIEQQGHKVLRIRIPPPGEHPHQRLLFAVSGVFLLFSGITLVLSAILSATMVDSLITQQIRQIGIMKAIGASETQIIYLYLILICCVSLIATVIGIALGLDAGRAFSTMILHNLNFSFHNTPLPHSIYIALMITGILLPLLMTAIPIIKTSRIKIQNALTHTSTSGSYFSETKFSGWIYKIPLMDRSLAMALRNSFRRRGRLMLTLTLLASSGAMFISGINLKYAAQKFLVSAAAERHYDLEISLRTAEKAGVIRSLLQEIDGVTLVEAWSSTPLARHNPYGFNIEKTFFDGGHGAVVLTAIPENCSLLTIKIQQGNWLNLQDKEGDNTVVINKKAQEAFIHTHIGNDITIGAAGNAYTLRIIGIADQKMTSGMAYVSAATYKKITGQNESYKKYRIVMKQHDDAFINRLTHKIEEKLAENNIKVSNTLTEGSLRHEIDGHFTMLISALFFTSIIIAAVGLFCLGSSINTHVLERIRELGIMRSIGATPRIIMRNIILESVCISVISWMAAIALSLPLSLAMSQFLGNLIFDDPFLLAVSLPAVCSWLVIVVACAILASVYPARKATKISIRESLSY